MRLSVQVRSNPFQNDFAESHLSNNKLPQTQQQQAANFFSKSYSLDVKSKTPQIHGTFECPPLQQRT